jgi:Tol biopolymer transport system component
MVHDGGRRKPGGTVAKKGALSLEKTHILRRNATPAFPRILRASTPLLAYTYLPASVLLFMAVLVFLLHPLSCWAQGTFGKNKVQYSELQWFEMDGKYVTLYFYSEERDIASRALAMAESTAVMLADTLQHQLSKKIPLVLFSSHRDFQQSNIIPYLLPEEVGGLTEFVKGRVLVPYTGSFYRFRWVLTHEMTHAFMLDKMESALNKNQKVLSFYPPLWLSEGLAEYIAAKPNPAAETILRDAVLSGDAVGIDEMWKIENSVLVYREGQSLVAYIANAFGFSSIVRLLENWGTERTFETLLEKTIGIPTRELSRRWMLTLKAKYYPDVTTREWASSFAESTVSRGRFNLSPVWARVGNDREGIAYLATEGETPELRIHELGTRGRDRRLVRGGTSTQFESLHLFRSRLSANKDGVLAFSAQREEADVIHLFDLRDRRRKATVEIPGLISLSSPSWSPDGTELVLSGQDASGRSDIFVVSLKGGTLTRLTSDFYDDTDPDWSPDGDWIVFSSDRCSGGEEGVYKLFLISPATHDIVKITSGPFSDTGARWSPSGKYIAFVSDRGGVPDLFLLDVTTRATARVTDSMAGVLYPSWGNEGTFLYFTALSSGKYSVYRMKVSPENLAWEGLDQSEMAQKPLPGAYLSPWTEFSPAAQSGIPYKRRFGLDIVQGAMGYDPEFAQMGSGQVALSDILGNEHLLFYLSSQGEYGGNLLGSLSAGVTYINLSKRLSYGIGLFSLGVVYDEELGLLREERRTGVLLLTSYPLSRFGRLDATLVGRLAHDYLYRTGGKANVFLLSNYFSYVWDNSTFESNGEIVGTRANITFGLTRDITRGKADYLTALADLRENLSLSRKAVYASRIVLEASFGKEGTRFYMGGPWSLRGYATRSMSGKTLLLANNELRLPALARIVLGFSGQRLPLPTIKGALFADVGAAGERELDTWRGSLGFGIYVGGGYFPIVRFNTAWRTDFATLKRKPVREFFVGWNF